MSAYVWQVCDAQEADEEVAEQLQQSRDTLLHATVRCVPLCVHHPFGAGYNENLKCLLKCYLVSFPERMSLWAYIHRKRTTAL